MNIDPEIVAAVSVVSAFLGGIISLLFTIVPGLNTWFAAKEPDFKRSFMALAGLVIAILVVLAKGSGDNIWNLIMQTALAWFAYTNTNQTTDRIIQKPKAVQDARTEKRTVPGGN